MKWLVPLAVLCAGTIHRGHAQVAKPAPGLQLVAVRAEPARPAFGAAFTLQVTLRVPPGFVVFLPDTLLSAEAVHNVGRGSWRIEADSIAFQRIHATYPVIAFREGRLRLPAIEVATRRLAGSEGRSPGAVRSMAQAASAGAPLARRRLNLGTVDVGPLLEMADSNADLAPHPPADVLGGNWSPWLVLAALITALAVSFGGWVLVRRWWRTVAGRSSPRSAREDALQALEQIRASGWHTNGRVDEFYASTTGVLRRFATSTNPDWGASLTSTELLAKMAVRPGLGDLERLGAAMMVAERVKFGGVRPDSQTAERDWDVIVSWIRNTPGS